MRGLKTKLTCALLSAAMLITGCGDKAGKMRDDMTAFDYAEEMGIGINLGNTMEAYWEDLKNKNSGCSVIGENTPLDYEKCWGAVETTREAIEGYKDAGFSTVRIPVYWGNMMKNDDSYTISEEYFERIDELIGYCLDDGMYAVINVHHYDEFLIKNHEKEDVLEITDKIWTQIAEHYKDYSDYLVFEGFNESLGSQRENDDYTEDELFDYVNEMNQVFVDAVRGTGGNNKERLLIASGYWTNIDKTTDVRYILPKDKTDDRMMVSVHYIDNACYWTNKIGNDEWIKYSTDQCELLKKAFTDNGVPVFVGECTSIYEDQRITKNATYTESSECLSYMMNMAVDYGFVPVLWDVNDNFYSRTDCVIKSESDRAVIKEISEKIGEN